LVLPGSLARWPHIGVQSFLRKLLTVDVPALMVLPKRLEIGIPPSVTTVAEAAVGRDVIMRAVASAVLQARCACCPVLCFAGEIYGWAR
jgi:hypothetical protein